jgi:hypothetical protein
MEDPMPHDFLTTSRKSRIVPIWDYRGLLLSLGSGPQVVKRIKRAGYDAPSSATIRGWRYKGRVPSEWVPLFLQWAIKEGTISDVGQLLVKGKVQL